MTGPHSPAHGWLILDKPVGLGSTQAVGAVKRVLREAGLPKMRVGHGGTLDPLASGILPIAIGEATKLTGRMLDADKLYEFTVAFGAETDTLDLEGRVVATSAVRPTAAQLTAVLPRFTGRIAQVPPAFSAIRIEGARAYDRARAGQEVVLAPREVTIHALDLLDASAEQATLRAHVSKGTYIRSLARDIALALGTCGHVTMLRRLKAGPFTATRAISLDMLNEIGKGPSLAPYLLPLEAGLDGIPALNLSPVQAEAVRSGRVLTGLPVGDGLHAAMFHHRLMALVDVRSGEGKVERGFNHADPAE